ncbi:macro domain-containing protein [Bacillus phage vB_BanS_Chewbecca]|uniref:Macro domain-containing protein n=1 Tax=Bacillus phage vB_BanS_Chewbecca TaxID=2894786 RepID=A0AAE8YMG6_9CAUD|nr:macro domain-containing protein [Bacillus phage vB_BanS_Chewbecca]UGO46161.1 macro domain-containing protein [Bacillus phage vB_BanS_Chewbecca]
MIKVVNGDLLKAKEDILGHQVNCMGVMGSGIALQIKKEHPKAFKVYKELVEEAKNAQSDRFLLGKALVVGSNDKYIANLFGQYTYGSNGQFTLMNALQNSLIQLRQFAEARDLTVGLPFKIGSDRGGADWNEVLKLIEKAFEGYEDKITLYKFGG